MKLNIQNLYLFSCNTYAKYTSQNIYLINKDLEDNAKTVPNIIPAQASYN